MKIAIVAGMRRLGIKLWHVEVRGERQDYANFLREADILRQLDHPRIVRFREVGESQELVYFAMDFVPGTDGGKLLRQSDQPLPVHRAVRIVCQLLEALESAHSNGFVHRDINPSNLLTKQYVYDFPKELSKQLLMILQDDPVPVIQRRPDLPRPLVDAIQRGLAREPVDRFCDVAAFRQAILPFVRPT